jgi:transposase
MEYVGFDLSKVNSQICLITEEGEIVEKRIKTERETLAQFFGQCCGEIRVLIEASTGSEWVARFLQEIGCQVIIADPNFAAIYATRSKKVKTDRRDARALCEASRLGAYRKCLETKNPLDRVVGNGPILVKKENGEVIRTALPIEEYIVRRLR